MGEQHRLAKALAVGADGRVDGDAGERREALEDARLEGQRHEGGAGLGDVEPELLGQLIAEAGGAHLGDRLAAGGDDQRTARVISPVDRRTTKPVSAFSTALDFGAEFEFGAGLAHLAGQQVDDLHRRAVAEQLAEGLFVKGDAVGSHQLDEAAAACSGDSAETANLGLSRQEAVGPRVDVGEIAAPAARDADLFAGRLGVVDDQRRVRPRLPASMAAIMPAAPAPRITTSTLRAEGLVLIAGFYLRYRRPPMGLACGS